MVGILLYQGSPGKNPHRGIMIDGSDIDFGPASGIISLTPSPGVCPWPTNGNGIYGKGGDVIDRIEIAKKKMGGVLMHPGGNLKSCYFATKRDIVECIKTVCKKWNGKTWDLQKNNCWHFVWQASSECCITTSEIFDR